MGKRSFWGRYDIRAVVGDDFGPAQYRQIGRTYAQYLHRELGRPPEAHWVAVGHDARLHSPKLAEALIAGLMESGIHVMHLGLSTSPIVYFSEHLHTLNLDFPELAGTVVVTASHNPPEYNGVKFTYQKRTLEEDEFQALQALYFQQDDAPAALQEKPGSIRAYNILPDYLAAQARQFDRIGKGVKVVVDSGNATAGIVAPEALRRLGCEVVEIFTEPDGRFPNHHPDPCVYKNLELLMAKVRETGADLGVAFDGDADRLGVVDEQGRIIPGDYVTLFLTEDVLAEHPGAKVIFDIKSTQTLFQYIQGLGGQPMLSPSGHAYMKRTMKDLNIPLGGELSGHLFFRDKHWGFDDALYAACRVIESFAHRQSRQPGYKISEFRESLPQTLISEEIRVHCTPDDAKRLISDLKTTLERQPDFFGSPVTDILTMDGLRANIENGFFLVRRSGTEPCITLRFEAPDEATYRQIEKRIDELTAPLAAPL
jgi:phosphomannomutase/phosphoglucomutase